MQEDKQLDAKREFKNLVRKVKYARSLDKEKDYTNEEIAADMGLQPPYFNTLVGTKGKVNQDHLKKIREVYPEIFAETDLTIYKNKESGPSEPDYREKYIYALEKLVDRQESLLTSVQSRLTEVEQKLSEIRENQRISYSFQLAFQEYWVEHFGSDNGNLAIAEAKIGQKAFSQMQKLPLEGTLLPSADS